MGLENFLNNTKEKASGIAKKGAIIGLMGLGMMGYTNSVQAQSNDYDCVPCVENNGSDIFRAGTLESTNRGTVDKKDRTHVFLDNGDVATFSLEEGNSKESFVYIGEGDEPYDLCLQQTGIETRKIQEGDTFGTDNYTFEIDPNNLKNITLSSHPIQQGIHHRDLALYAVPEGNACNADNSIEGIPLSIYFRHESDRGDINFEAGRNAITDSVATNPVVEETQADNYNRNGISVTGGMTSDGRASTGLNYSRQVSDNVAVNAGVGYEFGSGRDETTSGHRVNILNDDPTVRQENLYQRTVTDLKEALKFSLGVDYKNVGISGFVKQNTGEQFNQDVKDRIGYNGTEAPGSTRTTTSQTSDPTQFGIEARGYIPLSDAVRLKVSADKTLGTFGESNENFDLGSDYNVQAGFQFRW